MGINFALAVGLLLAAPVHRILAQDAPAAGGCDARETTEACYRRMLTWAVDSLNAARTRGDTARRSLLKRQATAIMIDTCKRGVGAGCYLAGRVVLDAGLGDSAAERHSADLFHDGCYATRRSAPACAALAEAYTYSLGRRIILDSAQIFYREACGLDNATACMRAGSQMENATQADSAGAALGRKLLGAACNGNSALGCVDVAYYLDKELDDKTPAELGPERYAQLRDSAMSLYRRACEAGSPLGCNNLGADFSGALGHPVIADSALFYYELACRGPSRSGDTADDRVRPGSTPVMKGLEGRGPACNNLGNMFTTGQLVATDTLKALAYYQQGCAASSLDACVNRIRTDSAYGKSALSPYESVALVARTCFEGSSYGCDNLGWMLERNLGDTARAAPYYLRACELRDSNGCNNLGVMVGKTSKDRALKYYRRSCDFRNEYGCNNLGIVLQDSFQSPDLALNYYARACELRRIYGCMRAIAISSSHGLHAEEARYRTILCRTDATECKDKSLNRPAAR